MSVLPVLPEAIPEPLRSRPRWLNWIFGEPRPNGKRAKLPVHSRTGRRGIDVTDPRQLSAFNDAVERYCRGGVDGIGFSLAPPLAAVDLDGCVDPDSSDLEPWATDILSDFVTYAERSPSGEGLRLIGFGQLDPAKRCRRGPVEVYDRQRYVTLTGHRLPGSPLTVADCTGPFARLQDRITPPTDRPARVVDRGEGFAGPDAELLARAFRAANGERVRRAWDGPSETRSPSEDLLGLARSLAFWTGPDSLRLDRIITASPLFAACEAERSKWSKYRRGGTWGSVYVIQRAIDTCPVFYRGREVYICTGDHNTYTVGGIGKGVSESWGRMASEELAPGFEIPDTRGRLAAACWRLAGRRSGGHFFMAERDAAQLLGITKTPARKQLAKLEAAGVIRAIRRGCQRPAGGTATEFVWAGVVEVAR